MKALRLSERGGSGTFHTRLRQKLLGRMLASWPRRGRRLLEINCGKGYFSTFLEDSGFLVTSIEADSPLPRRDRPDPRRPLAAVTDLPFEAGVFDWAILHLREARRADLDLAVDECARVSSLGFAVTFWNRVSLALLLKGRTPGTMDAAEPATMPFWLPWRALGRLPAQRRLGSTLALPARCWRNDSPLAALNSFGRPLPFGAWCVIRVEYGPRCPLTALPLRLETGQP